MSMTKKEYWTAQLTPARLWTIFCIQFNEAYQISCIYPFVVFMMRDFGVSEGDVGVYAGLLTATFALTQFLSSYFWGSLSDKYGRRQALLLGLITSGLAIIVFGTSRNYSQAIIGRALNGTFNGNIGVAKSYVADITNSKNRTFAFSIFSLAFSTGIVVGSVCGGLLVETYDLSADGTHTPSRSLIFGTHFPYLLPCLVGAMSSVIAFVLAWIFVSDERQKTVVVALASAATANDVHNEMSMDGAADADADADAMRSKSLPMVSMKEWKRNSSSSYLDASFSKSKDDSALNLITAPVGRNLTELAQFSLIDTEGMATNSLYEGVQAFKTDQPEKHKLLKPTAFEQQSESEGDVKIASIKDLFQKTKIIHALVINSLIMLMLLTWNAMNPLLLAQRMGMNSTEIGVHTAWTGVFKFVFTWYGLPFLSKRYPNRTLYITFGSAMTVLIVLFPSIAVVPGVLEWNIWLLVALISFVGGFKYAFATLLGVAGICFVNNSIPAHAIGRGNGLAQALAAGLRGIGPLFGGILWTYSMKFDSIYAVYIAYAFMLIPAMYSVIHCFCFITLDLEQTWEERHSIDDYS